MEPRRHGAVAVTIPQGVLPLPTSRRVALTVSSGVAPDNDPQNPGGARAYVHLTVVADGVTAQDRGRIIAAVLPNQGANGGTSAIAEVQTSGAGDLGAADSIALAPVDLFREGPGLPESAALLAAAFTDGALFFTQGAVEWGLGAGGPAAWSPFRAWDLGPPDGPGARPGEVVDVALAQGQPDPAVTDANAYVGIVRGRVDADIYGATRTPQGWAAWDNYEIFRVLFPIDTEPAQFQRLDTAKTSEGLHVIGATETGQILHQLRPPAAPGTALFRDVEVVGVGTEVGFFTAVACG